MPNNVCNRLIIHCEDEIIMNKIKVMIFDEDKDKNKILTMQKMLPKPSGCTGQIGYNNYGHDWCCAVWGSKWDVYDASIDESGNTITAYYHTAWDANHPWVWALCRYINNTLDLDKGENIHNISVEHRYFDYAGDFGGIAKWNPAIEFSYEQYDSIKEYFKNHDIENYNMICKTEEIMNTGRTSKLSLRY